MELFYGEEDNEMNDSKISDDVGDGIVGHSSTTIYSLPISAREILDTIHYCKALVNHTKKITNKTLFK